MGDLQKVVNILATLISCLAVCYVLIQIYKLGRKTATIGNNGGTLTGYLCSYIKSLLLFDLQRKFSDHDMIDPSTLDNLEVLARAKWFIDRDDLEGAIRISQLLKGEAAQAVRDWLGDARAHLEARLLAQILVAHSAVSSMRSIY
ncbi:unnamed protein product [Haemonchus placei]|uniref:MICOS complex subunit MIC60 n=1 Tax=Haemonchus placei TaxID=6290 RepID=A0A0N4VXV3_HAEPC|nr:unnamed protein product [Haemonchus placei]